MKIPYALRMTFDKSLLSEEESEVEAAARRAFASFLTCNFRYSVPPPRYTPEDPSGRSARVPEAVVRGELEAESDGEGVKLVANASFAVWDSLPPPARPQARMEM